MNLRVWVLLALFCSPAFLGPVSAGPNARGTLIVHCNTNIVYSLGTSYCGESGLSSCESVVASVAPDPETPMVFCVFRAKPIADSGAR